MLPPSGPVTSSQSPGRAPAARATGAARRGLAQERHGDDQRAVPAIGVAADDGRVEGVGDFAQAQVQFLGQRPAALARQARR